MRALVQRVAKAAVVVENETVGAIGPGLMALVGVTHDDSPAQATKLADKIANLRVFDDSDGVMNLSLLDVDGAALVVSQFTLYGDTRKGRRPSYVDAAKPDVAEPLIETLVAALKERGVPVETGRFRTDMEITLVNVGPCTLSIEV